MEYFSAIKKEWDPAICDNMKGPWRYDAKGNKSDGERQIPYDFIHMWNLKKKPKKKTKQNKTNKQNKTKPNS